MYMVNIYKIYYAITKIILAHTFYTKGDKGVLDGMTRRLRHDVAFFKQKKKTKIASFSPILIAPIDRNWQSTKPKLNGFVSITYTTNKSLLK